MIKIYAPKLDIHEDFPIKTLIEVMKPYLKLYMLSIHSRTNNRKNIKILLKKKLSYFVSYNNKFGRKNIKILNNFGSKNNKPNIEYNTKHLPFSQINSEIFNNFSNDEIDKKTIRPFLYC